MILITGAAGFIGSQLTYKLWKNGEKLILIDNFSYGKEDNLIFSDKDFRREVVRLDIRDRSELKELFLNNKIDTVYHIAGIAPLPDNQINPQEAVDVNVTGTVNILELSRVSGVKKIVFASTTAIYENDKEFPSTENKLIYPTIIYSNSKFCAERFCESYVNTYGMNITCLRFSNVYGPHIDCLRKHPPFVGYMIRELFHERIPTFYSNGNQSRDYIFVEDLLDLALLVRESKGFEILNVSSESSYSVKDIFDITAKIMKKTHIIPNYEESNKFWQRYTELYEGKYKIKDEVLEHEVNKYTLCSNKLAKEKYGWIPKIGIEEGLKKSINYVVQMLREMEGN